MRKITIGFQIRGENIDSLRMMDESNSVLIGNRTDASLALVDKGKCNVQSCSF